MWFNKEFCIFNLVFCSMQESADLMKEFDCILFLLVKCSICLLDKYCIMKFVSFLLVQCSFCCVLVILCILIICRICSLYECMSTCSRMDFYCMYSCTQVEYMLTLLHAVEIHSLVFIISIHPFICIWTWSMMDEYVLQKEMNWNVWWVN